MASRVLDATLVAIAEHGLVPSVQASRMTLAAAPEALQGAVAAGILGCGSVILGAAETAGRLFCASMRWPRDKSLSLEAAASEVVREMRAAKQAIPGYGHPLHKARDPRVARLFAVAAEAGPPGHFIADRRSGGGGAAGHRGGDLRMNVSAAIPAVLLDAGFPRGAQGRAHPGAHREPDRAPARGADRPIGFVLSYQAAREQRYTGQDAPGFAEGGAVGNE